MNILVIGSGAREHSLCWAINKSPKKKKIFCIPGNAGISEIAECIDLKVEKILILDFCKKKEIDLIVIGPEKHLEEGLSDYLSQKGFLVFGPSKKASKLESSKVYSKKFLKKYKIPTARFKEFSNFLKAKKYLDQQTFPIVLKADGLASGKGVIICENLNEALVSLESIMVKKKFGEAGNKVVIEEFLKGFEMSYFVFFDKNSYSKLNYALDHKKAYDFDKGPNTGGMGAFTPSKKVNKELEKKILESVIKKTFYGLKEEKIIYRGILFVGLMITSSGPQVIEYNVRFGDPECQVLMRVLKSDILEIFEAVVKDKLKKVKIKNSKNYSICIVIASKGYPGSFAIDKEISNLNKVQKIKGIKIFHAGTKFLNEKIVSSGGRVLSITSESENLENAKKIAYNTINKLNWKHGFYRKDIGKKEK